MVHTNHSAKGHSSLSSSSSASPSVSPKSNTPIQISVDEDEPLSQNHKKGKKTKGKRSKSVSHLGDKSKLLGSKLVPKVPNEVEAPGFSLVDATGGDSFSTAEQMFRRLSTGSSDVRKATSHAQLSSTAHGMRLLSKDIQKSIVPLEVSRLMIVTKKQDSSLVYLAREMVEWILVNYPEIEIYVESSLESSSKFNSKEICLDSQCGTHRIKAWTPELIAQNSVHFDLIITLGGDGTVLYVSSIFQRDVPPVMSFSLGSLGFLTNFNYETFRQTLPRVLNSKIRSKMRMRLCCRVFRRRKSTKDGPQPRKKFDMICERHVLNELTIDRGPSPFISMLELFGDNSLLTVAQADGIIIATPTGSTAYSLSAGGSLVYPSVNAIAVTPICPHTLSFRPIILPDSMVLKVKLPANSRATAWASFDGKNRVELFKGDYIWIAASPFSFPTLESSPTEFIDSISRTLNWNAREQQKSFAHMLSQKNKRKYVTDAEKERQNLPEVKAPSDVEDEDVSAEEETLPIPRSGRGMKQAILAGSGKLKANFQL
ncbi:LAMI_0D08372g1_1 [Lachancea mirantina]|uniref:LAMI_0D08372g1_1 n=1 Tax=Lachancea mirantina TaxID=1230905 RepID=A0A1G4JD49_9SACH|nr:LAMI_0D08372g1_1 [Lachancea mirantina]